MENLWYNKNELRIYYGQLSLSKLKYFSRKCCEIYLHAILLTFDAQPPPKGHEVTQRTYNTHMFMFTIQTYTQIPNKNTKPLSNMQAVNIKRGHLGPNNNAFSLYPTTVKVHAEDNIKFYTFSLCGPTLYPRILEFHRFVVGIHEHYNQTCRFSPSIVDVERIF